MKTDDDRKAEIIRMICDLTKDIRTPSLLEEELWKITRRRDETIESDSDPDIEPLTRWFIP